MPMLPDSPFTLAIAETTPTTRPAASTRGPPEFPGLTAASVWIAPVSLAVRWRDPDFSADQPAVYYVRVLENPGCRWTAYDAIRAGVEPPEGARPIIQERAWSSPIWYRAP